MPRTWRSAPSEEATDHHSTIQAVGLRRRFGKTTGSGRARKARYDDHCLAVYEAAGFTSMDADNAHKTVFAFVLAMALGEAAELLWRARLRRVGGNEEEQIRDTIAQASDIAMQFPRLRARIEAMEDADPAASPDQSFEFGLQAILGGLAVQLAARPMPASRGTQSPVQAT